MPAYSGHCPTGRLCSCMVGSSNLAWYGLAGLAGLARSATYLILSLVSCVGIRHRQAGVFFVTTTESRPVGARALVCLTDFLRLPAHSPFTSLSLIFLSFFFFFTHICIVLHYHALSFGPIPPRVGRTRPVVSVISRLQEPRERFTESTEGRKEGLLVLGRYKLFMPFYLISAFTASYTTISNRS